jgi:pimeloyl-ACP methyl ester carboxylesterase
MEPVVFNECFGWLHEARGRHGVVLCNPFGYDAYCTHRGWRKLAESVAAAGMPTLRFDYPGTGDSAGLEEDPKRFDAWLGSIAAGVEWLREYTGVEQVSLVGLRLGATLAALAAARIGNIDGLVLLAPVITGRSCVPAGGNGVARCWACIRSQSATPNRVWKCTALGCMGTTSHSWTLLICGATTFHPRDAYFCSIPAIAPAQARLRNSTLHTACPSLRGSSTNSIAL